MSGVSQGCFGGGWGEVGQGGGFFFFYFVFFLYIFHIWSSVGLSLAWGVNEDDPYGLLPPLLAPATPWVVAPSHGGSMSLTPACSSRLVLPLSLWGGSKTRLDLTRGREKGLLLCPGSSSSPIPIPLKDAVVPVPTGVPVPYLHALLTWMPLELWCLLL